MTISSFVKLNKIKLKNKKNKQIKNKAVISLSAVGLILSGATLMQAVTPRNVCEHYGVWHYELWCRICCLYVSVVMLLFRMTCSRGIHNVPYNNRMPYFIIYWQWKSGSYLAVTRAVLSLELRLHSDSNQSVKALGMLWRDLSYTVARCQRCKLYRRSATYCVRLFKEVTGQQLPMGPVCIIILLHSKNLFGHVRCGRKPVWI